MCVIIAKQGLDFKRNLWEEMGQKEYETDTNTVPHEWNS